MIRSKIQRNSSDWVVLSLLFVCLSVGCKSPAGSTTSGAEIKKTEEALFTSLLEHSFRFNTFSARMNLDFSSAQQEFSSRVQMKMICDDRIQFSVQPLGLLEMFRIELSNDSIKILDRMNKRYVADNYIRLKREMDIDLNFPNLQAMFTNRMFVPGENQISGRHYPQFRIKKNNHTAEFQLKGGNETFYTFFADSDEKLLSTQIENQNQKFTIDYSNFRTLSGQSFPMKMTTRLSSDNQIQGTAILTFSPPEINNPLTMDFKIPSGFKRVTLEQMINSLRMK